MSHVGIQRLTAGHHQHDRAKDDERPHRMREEELEAVPWIRAQQDLRMLHDAADTQHRDAQEPGQHDPAERSADARGAVILEVEQGGDDDERERHHEARQRRADHFEPLHCAEHGDGRSDDSVAVKERAAEEPQQDERVAGRGPSLLALCLDDQCEQRVDAALTTVVGLEDETDVLDRDDQDQRPNDQGQQAKDIVRRRGDAIHALERVLDRIQRAGPDVAVNDAQGRKGKNGELLASWVGGRVMSCCRGGCFRSEIPCMRRTRYFSRGRFTRGGRFVHERGQRGDGEGMVRQSARNARPIWRRPSPLPVTPTRYLPLRMSSISFAARSSTCRTD